MNNDSTLIDYEKVYRDCAVGREDLSEEDKKTLIEMVALTKYGDGDVIYQWCAAVSGCQSTLLMELGRVHMQRYFAEVSLKKYSVNDSTWREEAKYIFSSR